MKSQGDIAIRVQNLSKCYEIYDKPRDRLKQFFVPRLQRMTRQRSKQYFREFRALKDMSFKIEKGKTIDIISWRGDACLKTRFEHNVEAALAE